jgi:hypothetical protein
MGSFVKLAAAVAIVAALSAPANAQSLKGKVTAAWTLVYGSESYRDGKMNMPWATGNMTELKTPEGVMTPINVWKRRSSGSKTDETIAHTKYNRENLPLQTFSGASVLQEP